MVRLAGVLCALIGVYISESLAQQCFDENSAYRLYSSLTVYPQQDSRSTLPDNAPAGCQASMLFMLVRNGRRTPTITELNNFEQRLPVLRQRILQSQSSQLCDRDRVNLQNWNMAVNASTADLLTFDGENEVKDLARRMSNRYPQLLGRQYNDRDFMVRHAYRTDRANSATGFAQGLGFNASVAFGPSQMERDLLLQFSAFCEADDNDIDDDILEDFLEATEVQTMIRSLTARLGLAPNSLSLDDIDAMYKMCAYDFAMNLPSPWCAVFTNGDLLLMELKEDMISAELYGYEDEINKKETCVLMKDFVDRLNDRQSQASQMPAAVAYFAKSETILPFFTSLGLFEDDDDIELEDGDLASLANRKWRTSLINPFMSNIAVTMYTCQGSEGLPTYSVKVAVNEVPVTLPRCSTTFCPMDNLMEMIEDFAEECSFEELCDGVSATSASISFLALMAVISTLYACLFS